MSNVVLQAEEVEKSYFLGGKELAVLQGVSLELQAGEFVALQGASGSGKSTLLNLIGGIDRSSTGKILFRDHDITDYSERQLTEYRRERIGFVFQFYNLVPTLTATENVIVATEIAKDPMLAGEALNLVHMGHRLDHFPSQLSGGEQQRVAIARAVAKNPDLLLCDEPTGALDLETGQLVLRALVDLNQRLQTTVIIITHNVAIAGIANRLIRLGSGTIAEDRENASPISPEEVTW